MTNNLMHARIAVAKANGMRLACIFPTIERRVGLFDTEAMPYLVEAGRLATLAMMPVILKMLNSRDGQSGYGQISCCRISGPQFTRPDRRERIKAIAICSAE
jgi:NTE family protein